jgi:protein-L-isoaspartate O-methyltransferase
MSFGSYVPSPDLVSLWWKEAKGSATERAMEVVAKAARYGYQAAVVEELTSGGDLDHD